MHTKGDRIDAKPVVVAVVSDWRRRPWTVERRLKSKKFWASEAGAALRKQFRLEALGRSRSPHATQRPTVRDIGWAAGFIEGEGHFRRQTARTGSGTELVSATQVDREPLEKLVRLFGGVIGKPHVYDKRPTWKPRSQWRVVGARARGVMMTLYPFMTKRRQAQIRKALYG